jgi:citrate lyase subunit beta / citryl-CoA lyase
MRSLLFVPGDSERKLEKSLASGADALIVDLEDSVSPDRKTAARGIAAEFIRDRRAGFAGRIYVRVNDFASGATDDDLAAVIASAPDGVMLPKCAAAADIGRLSVKLRVQEAEHGQRDGQTAIIALITETAKGLLGGASYTAPMARVAGLTWGAEDLSADLGARETRDGSGRYTDVFRLARAVTLLAASAMETAAIDTVFVDYRDEHGLKAECEAAERDGFTGKMAIHPAQVPVINGAFTPSRDSIEEARAVVEAFRAAGNPGVVGIGGKMFDRPHLRRAERLLARASANRPG